MQAGLLPLVTIIETLDSNRYSPPRCRRPFPSLVSQKDQVCLHQGAPNSGCPRSVCRERPLASVRKTEETLSPQEVLEGMRRARESFCSGRFVSRAAPWPGPARIGDVTGGGAVLWAPLAMCDDGN